MKLRLDHVTILGRSLDATLEFYGALLPLLGFHERRRGVWTDGDGFFVQLLEATPGTRDYARYAPGVNHLGFGAPDAAFVDGVRTAMAQAGHAMPAIQHLGGATALFVPDPDGLRIEITYSPPGVAVVD